MPRIIDNYQVQDLLLESDMYDAWTGLVFQDKWGTEGLVWDTGLDRNFSADNFFLNNLPTSGSNGYLMNNETFEEGYYDDQYSEENIDDLVEPGTVIDGTESAIHFTILQSGDYQPQKSRYLSQGFVCSNFTAGRSSAVRTDDTDGYDRDEMIKYELFYHPENFTYHVIPAPDIQFQMTFEEAVGICTEQDMLLGIFVHKSQNDLVKELMSSSGVDTAWIGLFYHDAQYTWAQIDLVLKGENFFVNNLDTTLTENQTYAHVITDQGLWRGVGAEFLAPAAVCMSRKSSNQDEMDKEQEILMKMSIEMYVDWLVSEHFSSLYIYVVGNGTSVRYDEIDAVCGKSSSAMGLIPALLLTEELNSRAQKLMGSLKVPDAWINIYYNHTSRNFVWDTEGFSLIDASRYFLNNLETWSCSDCYPYQEHSPVVLQANGSWKIVDQYSTSEAVVCMGFMEIANKIGWGFFLINGVPEVLGFEIVRLEYSDYVEGAYQRCGYDEGFSLVAPVVTSYILSEVADRLKDSDPPVPSHAWTGLNYTRNGFQTSFYGSTINVTLDTSYIDDSSYKVMTSVDFGLISSAPVAITAAGLLVVLPPDTTLDTIVCCTVNLDRLDTRYDTAMSLFNAMRALKILGNMETHKEVIIKTPLTTTIEGPANGVSEIPKPHGIPMSMELYEPDDLAEVGGRWGELDEGDLAVDVIDFTKKPKSWKSKLPESDKALLGISNLLFMKDKKDKPSEHAGPVTGDPSKKDLFNNEWQNTEVNLNHLDLEADRNRINALKAAYIDQCTFFDHEICSINLRKAILYQSKSLVKIIIRSHRIEFLRNPKALPTNQDKSSIVNMMDAFRVTPLMIAAQVGNYKIVKVLLQYGADPTIVTCAGDTALSIGARHHDEQMIKLLIDYGADIGVALCMVGLNRPSLYHKARYEEMLNAPTIGLSHYGFSFEPINILSQPKFLLRTRNPIYEAFKVGTIINKIGDKKDEYLGDCEQLESQTDDFAYYYLDQCRTMWEALLLLNDQQIHDANIDLLQYAMKRKKMKFISHHFCQQYIMDTWYGGVQRGRTKNTLKKLGYLFIYHLFMPFILIYALCKLIRGFDLMKYNGINNTRLMTIWNNLHVPVVSYIVDLFNFFVLCSVMTWTCLTITESYADTSWAEIVLWMCLAARFMVEMDKIRTQGKEFFKHAGNVVDLSVSCSIIFTVFLRLVAYAHIYDSEKFPLWSSYVYATAFLGLMLRMLEMLDITYTLGPLEGAIGKMMMDVIKVCLLLILCIVGFSVSMWTVTLQSYHYEVALASKNNSTSKKIEYPELFSSFNTTLVSLLWSTFGLIEPDNIGISYNNNADSYLKLLWGIYILTAMILFLNMLIAMLTETYVKVINNAEIEWKYARSVVVKKYVGTHPFMFPFNLILYPLFLLYHVVVEGRINRLEVKETNEADIEAIRQSGFLHQAIKKRFKSKFSDVLNIPYYYRTNIFDYYTTFPFQNTGKKRVHKRRMSTFRAPKRESESSSSQDGGSDQSGESDAL